MGGAFVGQAANDGFVTLEGEGAATIIRLPERISSSTQESLDIVQKGLEFLVRVVEQMEMEDKSTEQVLVTSRMHKMDPVFNHANSGFRRFSDFVKAAEQRGPVQIEIVPDKQPSIRIPSDSSDSSGERVTLLP